MPTVSELGHVAVIPPQLTTGVPRLTPVWLERFSTATACDVADAVGQLYAMSPVIGPLYRPTPTLVGQALTVKCWPGDNLAIYGGLSCVQDGDVLVIDNRGYTGSCGSGSNVLQVPRAAGLRGIVIDGAWRDVDVLQEQGMPIFGRARNTFSPPKRRPGEINVPVHCGGVVVHPGDLVIGDGEGVAIVPRQHIEIVWSALERRREHAEDSASASASASVKRSEYFNQLFEAAGGRTVAWTGDGSAR